MTNRFWPGANIDARYSGTSCSACGGGVVLEVAERGVELVFLDAFEGEEAGGLADAVDVAVIQVFHPCGEPFVRAVQQHELQEAGEVVQVLAGVEQVDDLGGLGNLSVAMFQIQAAPSPRMVSWRT